jgi:hypothetical protein
MRKKTSAKKKEVSEVKNDNRSPWSVDPDQELRDLMVHAIAITGKKRAEIIKLLMKSELPNFIERTKGKSDSAYRVYADHLSQEKNGGKQP